MQEDEGLCFIFELVTPDHIIIVRPKSEGLILHGCRDVNSLKEKTIEPFAQKYSWEVVKECFTVGSLEEGDPMKQISAKAEQLNPTEQEGYVLCDSNFNRVKVKSSDYLRMSWMFPVCPRKAHMTERHMLIVI